MNNPLGEKLILKMSFKSSWIQQFEFCFKHFFNFDSYSKTKASLVVKFCMKDFVYIQGMEKVLRLVKLFMASITPSL